MTIRNGDALGADLLGDERPSKRTMVSFSTTLRKDQVERLKELSARTGVPQAELVRQCLDWVLPSPHTLSVPRGGVAALPPCPDCHPGKDPGNICGATFKNTASKCGLSVCRLPPGHNIGGCLGADGRGLQ